MGNKISSPIFGDCYTPDNDVQNILETLIRTYPLAAFQFINRHILNPKGWMVSVAKISGGLKEDGTS